jgi:catechol 2,3-dioxygenase-like lactoylglutathione lyase family enzyme
MNYARTVRLLSWALYGSLLALAGPMDCVAAALVEAVDSVAIPVLDADRSSDFYTRVLSFRKTADREVASNAYEHLFGLFGLRVRLVRMQLGDESIELMQFLSPHGRPLPADFRSNDVSFQHIAIIVSDMDKAFAVLRENHVTFSSPGPQVLPPSNVQAAGIAAFYFKDLDGNPLEILHFPPDKGAPKWHRHAANPAAQSLFLGVDHSAIVVAHTSASLKYYRDFLGMTVVGESENSGPEQEHLNNVFGAHLRITSLRAQSGPGLELLEYVTPTTGRPYAKDSVASDQWQWVVNLRATPITTLTTIENISDHDWVSNAPITLDNSALGYRQAFMLRDPDGHVDNLTLQ